MTIPLEADPDPATDPEAAPDPEAADPDAAPEPAPDGVPDPVVGLAPDAAPELPEPALALEPDVPADDASVPVSGSCIPAASAWSLEPPLEPLGSPDPEGWLDAALHAAIADTATDATTAL